MIPSEIVLVRTMSLCWMKNIAVRLLAGGVMAALEQQPSFDLFE